MCSRAVRISQNQSLIDRHPIKIRPVKPTIAILAIPSFSRAAAKLLSPKEKAYMIELLEMNPQLGVVEPGTGGARKIRLPRIGSGKSGGYRVIYFYHSAESQLWLLDIYAKSDQTSTDRKKIRRCIAEIKQAGRP